MPRAKKLSSFSGHIGIYIYPLTRVLYTFNTSWQRNLALRERAPYAVSGKSQGIQLGVVQRTMFRAVQAKMVQDPHTYKYSQQPLEIARSHVPWYSSNTAPALWVPAPVLVWLCDAHCWAVLLQMELCRESSRTDTAGNTGRSFRVSALERTGSRCIKNAARFPFKCSLKALEIVRRWLSDIADFFKENISSLFNVRMTQLWDWA